MSVLAIALNPTIDISSDAIRVVPTHKVRTTGQRRHAGGGGVNVARVIANLGGRPKLLIMSGGATGALLEDTLQSLPIDLQIVHIAEPTRIAFMIHEEETGLEYRFVPDGPKVTERELADAKDLVAAHEGGFVVASGSLPRGAPASTYATYAEIAERNGSRFVLDTSGAALAETLGKAPVFLIKPSRSELETLVGHAVDDTGIADAALTLVHQGKTENVAVTLGADGALLANAQGVLQLPAIKVKTRSAVGAGDSFVAAMVHAITQGRPVREAFRYAIAAGAAATLSGGTELCSATDVEAIYAQMTGA